MEIASDQGKRRPGALDVTSLFRTFGSSLRPNLATSHPKVGTAPAPDGPYGMGQVLRYLLAL